MNCPADHDTPRLAVKKIQGYYTKQKVHTTFSDLSFIHLPIAYCLFNLVFFPLKSKYKKRVLNDNKIFKSAMKTKTSDNLNHKYVDQNFTV